jgi:hypothetical protein
MSLCKHKITPANIALTQYGHCRGNHTTTAQKRPCLALAHLVRHLTVGVLIQFQSSPCKAWGGHHLRLVQCGHLRHMYRGTPEQSKKKKVYSSREANSRSAGQETICLLWTLKFHYCAPKNQPLHHDLSQVNQTHTLILSSLKIHYKIILYLSSKTN